jgi:hypothetical protein
MSEDHGNVVELVPGQERSETYCLHESGCSICLRQSRHVHTLADEVLVMAGNASELLEMALELKRGEQKHRTLVSAAIGLVDFITRKADEISSETVRPKSHDCPAV